MLGAPIPPLDGYSFFARTVTAVSESVAPPSLTYEIVVSGTEGARRVTNHYSAWWRARDNFIVVNTISAEESEAPPPSSGTRFVVITPLGGFVAGRSESAPDLLGVPRLTPTYMFGLRSSALKVNAPSETSLPVIATVSSGRAYDVTIVGSEQISGIDCVHLRLRPLLNPKKHRLRELWIDRHSYEPVRAILQGNFLSGPETSAAWQVDFTMYNGTLLIASEKALGSLSLSKKTTASDVAIEFEKIDIEEAERPHILLQASAPQFLLEP